MDPEFDEQLFLEWLKNNDQIDPGYYRRIVGMTGESDYSAKLQQLATALEYDPQTGTGGYEESDYDVPIESNAYFQMESSKNAAESQAAQKLLQDEALSRGIHPDNVKYVGANSIDYIRNVQESQEESRRLGITPSGIQGYQTTRTGTVPGISRLGLNRVLASPGTEEAMRSKIRDMLLRNCDNLIDRGNGNTGTLRRSIEQGAIELDSERAEYRFTIADLTRDARKNKGYSERSYDAAQAKTRWYGPLVFQGRAGIVSHRGPMIFFSHGEWHKRRIVASAAPRNIFALSDDQTKQLAEEMAKLASPYIMDRLFDTRIYTWERGAGGRFTRGLGWSEA